MENLVDRTLDEYLGLLASATPTPGGGSASALAGAQGAALGAMVARASLGKKSCADYAELLTEVCTQLRDLTAELTLDVDRDADAYSALAAAMKLPRDSAEQLEARKEHIRRARLAAAEPPLSVLAKCADALLLIERLIGKSSASAVSDLGAGAALLRASAQGSWLNVLADLAGAGDAQRADEMTARARTLYKEALRRADTVLERVEEACAQNK